MKRKLYIEDVISYRPTKRVRFHEEDPRRSYHQHDPPLTDRCPKVRVATPADFVESNDVLLSRIHSYDDILARLQESTVLRFLGIEYSPPTKENWCQLQQITTLPTLEYFALCNFGNDREELGQDECVFDVNMLETLSKNTTIHNLALVDNNLSFYGKEVANMMTKNTTITVLRLDSNEFDEEDVIPMARALESNHTLTNLSLAENFLTDSIAEEFEKSLKKNTSLVELNIDNGSFTPRGYGSAECIRNRILRVFQTWPLDMTKWPTYWNRERISLELAVFSLCCNDKGVIEDIYVSICKCWGYAIKKIPDVYYYE